MEAVTHARRANFSALITAAISTEEHTLRGRVSFAGQWVSRSNGRRTPLEQLAEAQLSVGVDVQTVDHLGQAHLRLPHRHRYRRFSCLRRCRCCCLQ